jgi:1-deoxy-D-xylulose-5-phosphate reductoisomerase
MKNKISIFGSTGSIGKQALDIIENNPALYEVIALTAASNVKILAEQAKKIKAKVAVIRDEELYGELQNLLMGSGIIALSGRSGLKEATEYKMDVALLAIVGVEALEPMANLISNGVNIALANKEALISAGDYLKELAKKHQVELIPVDSEHHAISRCFDQKNKDKIEKVILTASGGAFRDLSILDLENVTKEQALKHPTWNMGSKITIDSATLVNKGLEIIEAHYLFEMPENQIEVVIHPESIIHSMVAYHDGSVIAHLSVPDMKIAISYALSWPNFYKIPESQTPRLNFPKTNLTFRDVDPVRHRVLWMAREALNKKVSLIFNSANEVAVDAFLKDKIKFISIIDIIEEALATINIKESSSFDEILDQNQFIKIKTTELIEKLYA